MSTLKVNSIQHSNGTDALTIDSTGHATFNKTFVPANPLTNRNLIINGDFQVDQRATLPLLNSNAESDIWLVDRFKSRFFYASGSDVNMSYEKRTDGLIKITSNFSPNWSSGANNWFAMATALEQRDANYLAGKTITISFDFESNVTGNFSIGLLFGTGGGAASNIDYATLFNYTAGSGIQRISKTITVPNSVPVNGGLNDAGLRLQMFGVADDVLNQYVTTPDTWGNTNKWVATGNTNWIQSGNWIAFGNIQLEVGDTATPFEHRPYDMELARCLRYCWQHTAEDNYEIYAVSACYSTSNSYAAYKYPVKMRAFPTVSFSATSDFQLLESLAAHTCTSVFGSEISSTSCQLDMHSTSNLVAGNAALIRANGVATDGTHYIRFDAEL